jgi:serine/threonine protein kinase
VRQVALKALKGRFSQQRFREFKHEAEILQLVQGSSVSATPECSSFPACYCAALFLLRCFEVSDIVWGWQGVCRLHGICIDSLPNLYLVTEPILGGTLEVHLQQMQSKGIPLDRAFAIARSIARQVCPCSCDIWTHNFAKHNLVFNLERAGV